jgi:hypothetical protein
MKRLFASALIAAMAAGSAPAFYAEDLQVTYSSGTAPGVQEGSSGTLNTSSPAALEFHGASSQFAIPYSGIIAFNLRDENRFRLGLLPAIAVGALKARSKRHFVTIAWKDDKGVANVVSLEMPHERSLGLMSILRVRAPKACSPQPGFRCSLTGQPAQ